MRILAVVLIGLLLFIGVGMILAQEFPPPPSPPPVVEDHNQPPGCEFYDLGAPFRPLEPKPAEEPIVCWVQTEAFPNGTGWRYLQEQAGQLLNLECVPLGTYRFARPVNDLMDPGNWSMVVHAYSGAYGAAFHQG